MSNRDRVLALVRAEPGLTDAEIRMRTGIEPHQQVNQICRALAAAGLIRRVPGPAGRIVNLPHENQSLARGTTRRRSVYVRPSTRPPRLQRVTQRAPVEHQLVLERSLIVIPCSGTKSPGNRTPSGPTVLDALPGDLAHELAARRLEVARKVGIDESILLPAVERYDGTLYTTGRPAIRLLASRGAAVVIISGGYGLVLSGESIGNYDQAFRPGLWPNRIIQRCLAGFAAHNGVRHVIGVLSATTGYASVFRKVPWPDTVDQVLLATPQAAPGAMQKAPQAEGEWLTELAGTGHLPTTNWSSSGGLGMDVSVR